MSIYVVLNGYVCVQAQQKRGIEPMLGLCLAIIYPANTRRWPNVGLMLAQPQSNIGPTPRLCKHEALAQCWADVGPSSTTLSQHQPNIGPTPRVYLVGRSANTSLALAQCLVLAWVWDQWDQIFLDNVQPDPLRSRCESLPSPHKK